MRLYVFHKLGVVRSTRIL